MLVRAENIVPLENLNASDLFIHLGMRGTPLCVCAEYPDKGQGADRRIIALRNELRPEEQNLPIYIGRTSGRAWVIEDARAELIPESVTRKSGAVFYLNGELLLPVREGGSSWYDNVVSLSSGLIQNKTGEMLGFAQWRITRPSTDVEIIFEAAPEE